MKLSSIILLAVLVTAVFEVLPVSDAQVRGKSSKASRNYSNVFFFGDSLTDGGNNGLFLNIPNGIPQTITNDSYVASLPFTPFGTFSNGPVWATMFAAGLGLTAAPSLAQGTNFAFGGARVKVDGIGLPGTGFPFSLSTQVRQFLNSTGNVAPSDALYIIAGGANDAFAAMRGMGPTPSQAAIMAVVSQTSAQYAIDMGILVDTLQAAGARNFVVGNVPDLGKTPFLLVSGAQASSLATLLSSNMNQALDYRMASETGVITYSGFNFTNKLIASPADYGLSNVSNACATDVCINASQYMFWDGIHLTAVANALLANEVLELVKKVPMAKSSKKQTFN